MNEYVKIGIGFAGGLITGLLIGYFFGKKKSDDEYEDEVDEIRTRYEDMTREICDYRRVSPEPEHTEESGVDDVAELEHPTEDETAEPGDYNDDDHDKNYYEGFEATEIHQKNRVPKLIREEDYGATRYLEECELFYYVGDGVLANENDEIIDNVEMYLGNALTKFGFAENDESVIYVRNWNLGCDFMVTKVRSSFKDVT